MNSGLNDNELSTSPPAPLPPAAPPRQRRFWRWALLLLLVCGMLALVASALALKSLSGLSGNGLHINIDDEIVHVGSLHTGTALLALGAVFAILLTVLCAVPVIVALALAAAALGIGIALLAVLTVAAIALSPLWLLALGVWWAVRPAKPRPVAAA